MNVTQNQIAEHLGISRVSVARALNGHGKVSDESRRVIEAAARELGYDEHSNRNARELVARRYGRRLRSGVIAMCFELAESADQTHDPFFLPFFQGARRAAAARGLDIFLWQSSGETLPRVIAEGNVDGVLCFNPSAVLRTHAETIGLSIVMLSTFLEGVHGLAPDDCEGTRLATQHLIDAGHQRIAYLGHLADFSASIGRIDGYQKALVENGIEIDSELLEATLRGPDFGGAGVARLLDRVAAFTGLVCHNDAIAMGAIRELEKRGLRVPRDVSVVGFDDISVQQHFTPALTSIAFDRVAMGARAVEVLCDPPDQPRHELFRVELIVRASTSSPLATAEPIATSEPSPIACGSAVQNGYEFS